MELTAAALTADSLTKEFAGKQALENVSFDLFPGEVVGLLGPNGAGKTTTLRMLVDLLRPDSGSVLLSGQPLARASLDRLGYLPEERGLYKRARVMEALCYFAALKGVEREVAAERSLALLAAFGLSDSVRSRCDALSKGMQQKVQLAATLLHDPDIVLLDEPFTGLDPLSIQQVREQITGLRQRGKAVLLSTHLMSEAQALCDRVVMLSQGRVVLTGAVTELRRRFADPRSWLVECDGTPVVRPPIERAVREAGRGAFRLLLEEGATSGNLLRVLGEQPVTVHRVGMEIPSLEQIFLQVAAVGGLSPTSGGRAA